MKRIKDAYKTYLKGSPKAVQPPAEPRDMKTLNEQYSLLCGSLGQAQYKLEVLKSDIATFTSRIAEIDREAKARQALDTAAAKTAPQEGQNEQARQ